MLNGKRLAAARKRRQLTAKGLAELCGLSPVTITRLEAERNEADPATVERIARVLSYPGDYFMQMDPPALSKEMVSFRSLTNMSAREREAAFAAGGAGVEMFAWAERTFALPGLALPDLRSAAEQSPESAAELLRQHWNLGDRPIAAVLKVFEARGIRILGLAEDTKNVDAFSFWMDDVPYMFLNSFKTAERSLFDAAHELGHLTMHRHGMMGASRVAENEANAFASAFLMPRSDVLARVPRYIDVKAILRLKKRWRVSAMALAYRLRQLDLLTEWQHRTICIQLGKMGYRSGEPEGIVRETSVVWSQILADLWSQRQSKESIAKAVRLPLDEVDGLLSGLLGAPKPVPTAQSKPEKLRLVE
ncbi:MULTISPECIES: helix-turn-helix domain-containing protein [unclassified Marinovum]|uniref:helix-turn-helix domain-containing protein n=1 Tax=unclassified Marinovum TaxID=2647166 RepID=UPI003EDC3D69